MDGAQLAISQAQKANDELKANSEQSHGALGWVEDNVLKPAVKGSGVLQIYNTFAPKADQVALPEAPQAKIGSVDWAVQTLAGAGGAIVPYVLAGKAMGRGLNALGVEVGARGAAARCFFANDTAAQILGAGAYEALKKPEQGETRLGNSLGTMAAFGVFEGGNKLAGNIGKTWESRAAQIGARSLARAGVGAAGSLLSYGISNETASWQTGQPNRANLGDAFSAAASGAFMNVGLPAIQHGVTKAVDIGYNARSYGPGVPVGRYIESHGYSSHPELVDLARDNPLARVKETRTGATQADVENNRVQINTKEAAGSDAVKAGAKGDAGTLTHELEHLRLARVLAPHYEWLGQQLSKAPNEARANQLEQQYYWLREYTETQARSAGDPVRARQLGTDAPPAAADNATAIRDQIAGNGKTYLENWQEEWKAVKEDPKFKPRYEFDEAKDEPQPVARVTEPGSPENLGATLVRDGKEVKGVNFAIHSTAAGVDLLLFDKADATTPTDVIPLTKDADGNIFHRYLPGAQPGQLYAYRVHGEWNPAEGKWTNLNDVIMDPWGKAFTGETNRPRTFDNSDPEDETRYFRQRTTDNVADMPKAVVIDDDAFDWQGVKPPDIPKTDVIAAEINVRAFTALDESVPEHLRGTYLGLIYKIPLLKKLGYNAVKLMPTDYFDWEEDGRTNDWGYQPWNYFAPKSELAFNKAPGAAVDEQKTMVRELNRNGIMVISDEVYNHTSEGGTAGPTISYRALDNAGYYMLDPNNKSKYIDYTGVGNTLNPSSPIVQRLVLDSLRYKANQMHFSGIRYDLGATFLYDPQQVVLNQMQSDPVLSKMLHVIEPWNIARWNEGQFARGFWNESGKARDTMRGAVKSDSGMMGPLASMVMGLPNIYGIGQNAPEAFITSHDGFTLNDLWSYMEKHNEANGEGNRDGEPNNHNWNGGVEGPTNDPAILELRRRLALNSFLLNLMPTNRSIVMTQFGDEFGQTKNGNNNSYCQPELNNIDWKRAEANKDQMERSARLIKLRDEHKLGRVPMDNVTFFGTDGTPHQKIDVKRWRPPTAAEQAAQGNANWVQETIPKGGIKVEDDARFLAWEVNGSGENGDKKLFVVSNNYWEPLQFKLPAGKWKLYEDTNLQNHEVLNGELPTVDGGSTYTAGARSALIFEAVP